MSLSAQKKELLELELKYGAARKQPVTAAEAAEFSEKRKNKGHLPQGIFYGDYPDPQTGMNRTGFFRVVGDELTQEEKNELIMLKQLKAQETANGWLTFFGVITIIGIIAGIILTLVKCSQH